MNKLLLSLTLLAGSTPVLAHTPYYYAAGEDIDNMIYDEEASTLMLLEEKLLQFSLFRKLEAFFLNVEYIDVDEEQTDIVVKDSEEQG